MSRNFRERMKVGRDCEFIFEERENPRISWRINMYQPPWDFGALAVLVVG